MAGTGKEYSIIFNLKAQLASGFASIFQQASGQMGNLSEAAQALNARIGTMEGFDQARQQAAELYYRQTELENALTANKNAVGEQDAAMRQLTAAQEQQEQAVAELTAKYQTADTELKELEAVLKTSSAQVTALTAEQTKQQSVVDKLKASLTEARAAEQQLSQQEQQAEATVKTLSAQKEQLAQQVQTLQSKLTQEKSALQETSAELTKANSSVRSLTSQKEKLETKIAGLNSKIETERQQLSEVNAAMTQEGADTAALTAQKKKLEAAIQKDTAQLAQEEGKLSSVNGKLTEAAAKAQTLTAQKNQQAQTIQKLNAQLTQEQAAYEKVSSELSKTQQQVETLTAQWEKQSQKVEELNTKYQAEQAKLDEINTKLAQAKTDVADLTAEQEKQAQKVEQVKAALDQESAALDKTTADLAENKTATQTLLDAKARLEDEIKSNRAALENAEQTLEKYRQELEKAGISEAELEQELQKAKAALEEEKAAMEKAAAELQQFTSFAEDVNSLATGLSGVRVVMEEISEAATGVVSAFASCLESAAALEYQMSAVQAVSGSTDAELEGLTSMVKELGATTIYTATEVAEATQTAALAGWEYEDLLEGMPSVTKLAAASGEELADVVSTVADAMSAFGLSGSEAVTEFTDTLVQAATSANTTVAQLSDALSYVESTAANLGYSIQDVSVVLDVLANNSLKAGVAGSALNTMLTRMSGANSNAAEQMDALNLSMYNTDGTAKDLLTFMGELRDSFADFGDDAQSAQIAAYNLAGQRGMRALLTIVNATEEEWQDMVEAVYDYEGATESISETRLDNYTGQVQLLNDAWDALKTTVGENFLPAATDAVEILTDVVNVLNNAAESTGFLQTGLLAGASSMAVLAGGATTAITVIQKISMMLTTVSSQLQDANGKFATLFKTLGGFSGIASKAGAISLAIAGIAAVVTIFKNEWDSITEGANAAKESLEELKETTQETNEAIDKLLEGDYSSDDISGNISELESQLEEYKAGLEETQAEYEEWYAENVAGKSGYEYSFFGGLALNKADNTYQSTMEDYQEQIDEVTEKIAEQRKLYVEALVEEIKETTNLNEITDEQYESLDTLAEQVETFGDAWSEAYMEVYDTLTGNWGLLDQVEDDVRDSIMDAFGLTDEIDTEYEATMSSMLSNLEKRTELLTSYNDGLAAIQQSGVDVSDIWDDLTDGSDEAMEAVNAIYKAIQSGDTSKLQEYIDAYAKMGEEADRTSEIASTSTEEIVGNLETQLSAITEYRDNLETILNSGIDVSNLWDSLSDGSEDAMTTAAASVSGTTAAITVTAAAGTKYGGDISYIIERKINDRDWEEVSDGSDLTVSETVGSDLVTYTARVTAYCDGFTGDAVTSDTVTVSQSGSRYCWEMYSADEATDYGLVTDNDLSAHALDGTDTDGYYYDYLGSDDIDATAVSYGSTATAGSTIRIDVTASGGNSYGGVAKYIYQYSTDGGSSWTTANSGTSATSLSMKVPSGSETFQARVQTIDDYGYTSTTWVYGEALTCDNNTAPTVLATSTALGTVTAAFTVNYDVTDLDGDALTVTEALDGDTLRTRTVSASDAAAGTTLTLTVTADQFMALSNGEHTLTITAEDGGGKTGTATITFTKALYTCTATWLAAKGTDSVIKRVYIGVAGDIPDSATVEMLVTNDNGVTWEDATEAFLSGDPYTFATTEADNPAFNFQLTCTRGSDSEGGYIDDLSFILDTGEVSEYGNTVAILTHAKVGTEHQLTGLNGRAGLIAVQFKTTDSYDSGDTCTVEGETYTLQTATGADVAFETGRGIMAVVDTDEATVTLQL